MDYYSNDYKSWRKAQKLPNAECYDMEEVLFTRRVYVEKRYLWGLIKLRRPTTEVITRYKLKDERDESREPI